jgi:8-oxo-dGTP pyrophosphatase MutT (NUDIX family)
MPHPSWTFLGSSEATDYKIFRLRHDRYRFEPTGDEGEFVVLDCPAWVNVVPLTADGKVLLIRQYRHGIREATLEVPGGMVERGEPPEAAAARELAEETGYAAGKIRPLARVLPNPAVQNNYLYLFAAEGCRKAGPPKPDRFEHIEVLETPLADIPAMIRDGRIAHAMVIAAFAFLGLAAPPPA